MKRFLLPCFALALTTSACFGGIAEGLAEGVGEGIGKALECVGDAFGKSIGVLVSESIPSEQGGHELYGLCDLDEECERVVMVGAELALWVDDTESSSGDDATLETATPEQVVVEPNVEDCGIPAATVRATSEGEASITLEESGVVVATFSLEVAEAATMSLGYGNIDDPESIAMLAGDDTIVTARIHDDAGRPLAAGASVRWSTSSPTVVGFVDGDDVGQTIRLEAIGSGSATITAEAAGMAVTVDVHVE